MGYKPVYNLTKPSAVCYNDVGYNYHPIQNITCQCSYLDYEWLVNKRDHVTPNIADSSLCTVITVTMDTSVATELHVQRCLNWLSPSSVLPA